MLDPREHDGHINMDILTILTVDVVRRCKTVLPR